MTTQFDPSEFTEPFDAARFEDGESAMMAGRELRTFKRKDKDGRFFSKENGPMNGPSFYRMRPAQDGWIEHDGSEECPIPWAKAGEYEARYKNGRKACSDIIGAAAFSTGLDYWRHQCTGKEIVAYHLTDGWVPVKSGECPKLPGSGSWEYKYRDGQIVRAVSSSHELLDSCFWADTHGAATVVAVRRVPAQSAQSIDIDEYVEFISMNPETKQALEEGRQWVQETFYTEQIKHQLDGIDADIREIFNISSIIDNAFAEARDGKKVIGPVVEVNKDVVKMIMLGMW